MGKLELKNLDKSKWQTFPFEEIAFSITERVDPTNTDLEIYVGLEHIDPESIHIKRFGSREDVKGTKLRCYPDDIIFGRRRAYQRKAAIVEFDGFCSAHSLVLRANPAVIDPNLFPFFLHSDTFMNRAIDISVGSLSPTINWSTLKKQEFLLPPKDQQAQIAELLWAMDEVVEKSITLNIKLEETLNTKIEKEIHGVELNNKTISQVLTEIENSIGINSLENLGILLKGKGIQKKDLIDNGNPCVRYGELYTKHHRIIKDYHSFIPDNKTGKSFLLKKNDVLIAGSGETIEEIGKSAAFIGKDVIYAGSDIIVFRPYNMNGIYLGYLMNSLIVRKQLNKYGTGATVMHIYRGDIKKIIVPKINRREQDNIAHNLECYRKIIELNTDKIYQTKQLQKSLINEIFS